MTKQHQDEADLQQKDRSTNSGLKEKITNMQKSHPSRWLNLYLKSTAISEILF